MSINILDLVHRSAIPAPWQEGDNIPWNEPGFSQRMLREHLTQEHDAASRRFEIIDQHVTWIHDHILSSNPTRILDLGCGPGLYSARLARLGHSCVGIDYSPASVSYATQAALQEGLSCIYTCQDLRQADFGEGFGLVMQIYGELNVFRPADARHILNKASRALQPGGFLLLEVHVYKTILDIGKQRAAWYTSPGGLFSEDPHIVLEEYFWDAEQLAATIRYFTIDSASATVTHYAQSLQAYTDEGYHCLLESCEFSEIKIFPSLGGALSEPPGELIVLLARKCQAA